VFQFSCRFALFINLLSLKPDSENIANFNAVSRKHANFDEVQFFEKNIPQFIIFGTHNLQTFQHNAFISELLVMPFYLFNIRPKLHHLKGRKLRVVLRRVICCSERSQLHQQPVDAVFRPSLIRKLCYKLSSIVTFTFIQTFDQIFVFFIKRRHFDKRKFQNSPYFRCPV